MKKIKSPWYGVIWIVVWTAALIWFLSSGMFDQRESIGLFLVWAILVGITGYFLAQDVRMYLKRSREPVGVKPPVRTPSLNGPCPCGSGKKYKRCCAVKAS